jgi:Domain of unknown function (DUF4139)/N-terminal domain of unknown function (DUF4140)
MKKIILLCLITNLTFGQAVKEQLADSKIEKVTVFLSGAQVMRSAKVSVSSGKTEIRFNRITPDLDVNSVQVKSEGDVAIQSVTHEKDFLGAKPSIAEITKLENQRETIQDKIALDKSLLTVYKREEEMLIKNQLIVGQNTGLKAMDLKESVDFQRLRMTEVLAKQLELEKIIKKADIEALKITNQIAQITGNRGEETSVVVITVLSNNPTNVNFTLSYFVANTNWTPSYDLRVKDISKPLNLTFKANINQNSGEDWKDVKLSLSTGEPQKQGVAPVLYTWYIEPTPQVSMTRFAPPTISKSYPPDNSLFNPSIREVGGKITDERGEALPGVTIVVVGTKIGTVSNGAGFYSIKIPNGSTTLQYSAVGFLQRQLTVSQSSIHTFLYDNVSSLQEVVVTGYAARGASDGFGSDKENDGWAGKVAGIQMMAATNYQQTEKSFDLPQPYTIKTGSENFQVELKPLEIPATYEYYVAPKYDKDAFLTAKIVDWEQYDLMAGTMKLYFEDTYLGDSYLNVNNQDTLSISLGRDKGVVVSRNKMTDFRKKQSLGSNKVDSRGYEIVVRNTKRQAINLTIEDQFPISKAKEIEVDDQEADEAEINKETGKITWKLKLESNKDKKLKHKFTVKSPKGMVLNLD